MKGNITTNNNLFITKPVKCRCFKVVSETVFLKSLLGFLLKENSNIFNMNIMNSFGGGDGGKFY